MDGVEKTIDGTTFKVLMLDPLVANDLLVDIGKTFGPALGAIAAALLQAKDTKAAWSQLMEGVKGPKEAGADDLGEFAEKLDPNSREVVKSLIGSGLERAVVSLIDRIEKHKLREIIQIMETVTTVQQGKDWPELRSVSTVLFRGRLKLMYQWLGFAIRTQYRDFF